MVGMVVEGMECGVVDGGFMLIWCGDFVGGCC